MPSLACFRICLAFLLLLAGGMRNLTEVTSSLRAKIHESFSLQRKDAASGGWHFLTHGPQKRRTRWEGAEPNYCLLWLLQILCLFWLFQVRIHNNIPEQMGKNTRRQQLGYVSWAPVTVRYCVTAGSATSRRKTLRAERGKAFVKSKPAREREGSNWRRWVAPAAARRLRYAHGNRLPSSRCASVSCEGFSKWGLQTYLLLAWKSNSHQIITNNWEQIIIK